MSALGRSIILLRCCAMVAFLSYLFAGASLALPTQPRCARCNQLGTIDTIKAGASCPLSYHGHHCHNNVKKSSDSITLCPDGCLHHDEQGGEIPSLAKFLAVL